MGFSPNQTKTRAKNCTRTRNDHTAELVHYDFKDSRLLGVKDQRFGSFFIFVVIVKQYYTTLRIRPSYVQPKQVVKIKMIVTN